LRGRLVWDQDAAQCRRLTLERLVFDLSFLKILVLGVLALVIFGPEQLPSMAAKGGRMLRELRRMAEGAKADLQESLGPEFADFDINDLNPRHFVRKHLLDDLGDEYAPAIAGAQPTATETIATDMAERLSPGESPPYDIEAT
jgi:sec-independent protein translocase protein TatB